MQYRLKGILALLAVVLVASVGLFAYGKYAQQMVYEESTSNFQGTCEQIERTFILFANRNWSFLSDWCHSLGSMDSNADFEREWASFAERKDSWNYSEFYLFNDESNYLTASGRKGSQESISPVFDEMIESGTPTISSYIASSGTRKIVFAVPLDTPFEYDGVTYTGTAVCYESEYVQGLVAEGLYSSGSDCYMIRSNGDVVFSLAPKNVFPDYIGNIFDFLNDQVSFKEGSLDQMRQSVLQSEQGKAACSFDGRSLYVVSQPVSYSDWSLVAFVDCDVMDSSMHQFQTVSAAVSVGVVGLLALAIVLLVVRDARSSMSAKEQERMLAEREKELTGQLFNGVTQIVDRFAVGDLVTDRYEYHERQLSHFLYPRQGSYHDLVEFISRRCVVLTDTENAKVSRLICPEYLSKVLTKPEDILRFEYTERGGGAYELMTVVPLEWSQTGQLQKVLLISLDIGKKMKWKNIANTDGLTGLFNERYFSRIMHLKEQGKKPFVLYYLDLDGFKPVNDEYGHDMGDKLLREVASRLKDCVRSNDYAFRIGGDEFTLIISADFDKEQCEEMVQRIKSSVSNPYVIDGIAITVGTSCAYAAYPDDNALVSEVRKIADQRMYEDKESRNAGR